ncbi:hypothetical protein HZS_4779 [Henneguya salminicola]|nr:hypothetical protein HZS_4779 [Henneguya salminicola]
MSEKCESTNIPLQTEYSKSSKEKPIKNDYIHSTLNMHTVSEYNKSLRKFASDCLDFIDLQMRA